MKPIHNIRILDMTRLLPGAVCTMLLHDLGAEIIKVEDPVAGDYARLMPPLIDGMGAFFRSSNRGKKSIALDLKQDAGQTVLHRLVENADALIEGFRPGVTARLGADYETLRAINPQGWSIARFPAGGRRVRWRMSAGTISITSRGTGCWAGS